MLPEEPLAKDILNQKVHVIDLNKSVLEAAKTMKKKKIRELIVVSKDEIEGIIVDRDITNKVVALKKDPQKIKVRQIMTKRLITASENDTVEDIARAMIKNDISRIPVLRGDHLIGLVTYREILRTWPAYQDLLEVEANLTSPEESELEEETRTNSGYCDSCGNYSDELIEVNGEFLCRDCREKEKY